MWTERAGVLVLRRCSCPAGRCEALVADLQLAAFSPPAFPFCTTSDAYPHNVPAALLTHRRLPPRYSPACSRETLGPPLSRVAAGGAESRRLKRVAAVAAVSRRAAAGLRFGGSMSGRGCSGASRRTGRNEKREGSWQQRKREGTRCGTERRRKTGLECAAGRAVLGRREAPGCPHTCN